MARKAAVIDPAEVSMYAVDEFVPARRQRGTTNPYVEIVEGAEWETWHLIDTDTEEVRDGAIKLVRAAGQYCGLSVRVRTNDEGYAAWRVVGEIKRRAPRTNGD